MGLIPISQNLTCRIASAPAAGFSSGTEGFGRRFIRPDYRISAHPSPDTPEILMLSGQTQIGDIGKIIGPVDLHDIGAPLLTISLRFHQPHDPSHASIPGHRTDAAIRRWCTRPVQEW